MGFINLIGIVGIVLMTGCTQIVTGVDPVEVSLSKIENPDLTINSSYDYACTFSRSTREMKCVDAQDSTRTFYNGNPNVSTPAVIAEGGQLRGFFENGTTQNWYWGTNAPSSITTIPGLSNVVQMTSGSGGHTCALISDGTVQCYGSDFDYQYLGYEPVTTSFVNPGPIVTNIAGATQIAGGDFHNCALLSDETVRCWGYNISYQLGFFNPPGFTQGYFAKTTSIPGLNGVLQITAGGGYSCALIRIVPNSAAGAVKCWGKGPYLGAPYTTSGSSDMQYPDFVALSTHALRVSAGRYHACAIMEDRTLECWGANGNNQISPGSGVSYYAQPVKVPGISGVISISTGFSHTCVVLEANNELKCWGGLYW